MRVLVIDDTKSVHAFINSILEDSVTEIGHCYDGKDGVEHLKNNASYDVILMDWEMPILTGVDAVLEIRKLGLKTPIIMVTTKNKIQDIQLAITNGANEYVMKPFTKEIILEKIKTVTEGIAA